MSNKVDLVSCLKASIPALWIETTEVERAVNELGFLAIKDQFNAYSWDCRTGIRNIDDDTNAKNAPMSIMDAFDTIDKFSKRSVIFLQNAHKFLSSVEVLQTILNKLKDYELSQKTIVIVAPVVALPVEIEKFFVVMDFGLPDKTMLEEYATEILESAESSDGKKISKTDITRMLGDKEAVVTAACGLTKFEAKNAFSLSLSIKKVYDSEFIAEMKAQIVRKNGNLEMSSFKENFEGIIGLDTLKDYTKSIFETDRKDLPRKGIMLVGVPGCAKSHFARALGNEVKRPTLTLDFGKLFNSYVGASENNIKNALKIVDAMSPCILFLDEIEKGLSGASSSSQSDGGTTMRVFGAFLTWLSDHESDVFVVATANDIKQLPPEFLRTGRWDGLFFIDIPSADERMEILEMYCNVYKVPLEPKKLKGLNIEDWTGAEIKQLAIQAARMDNDLVKASKYITPIIKSMADKVGNLREWAKSCAIPASDTIAATLETIEIPATRKVVVGQ